MKHFRLMTALLGGCLALIMYQGCVAAPQATEKPLGPAARWTPDASTVPRVRDECSPQGEARFAECFVQAMQQSGASPEAVAFARRLDTPGYMRDFRAVGRVDIAYAEYPFRANENYGWLLVNGQPPLIDVDDFKLLRQDELHASPVYAALAKRFPHITLWPADRFRTDKPRVETLSGGGQRFVVEYLLRNLCHACEVVGLARFAFDFDPAGTFLGTSLMQATAYAGTFADPARPVRVAVGQAFTLRLDANRTTGYRWQLAKPLDEAIVTLLDVQYREPSVGRPGAGGEELWTFQAVGQGRTRITLRYVRAWERATRPAKHLIFTVKAGEKRLK